LVLFFPQSQEVNSRKAESLLLKKEINTSTVSPMICIKKSAANAPEIYNIYCSICLILEYVNEGSIPTVVRKFTTDWRWK